MCACCASTCPPGGTTAWEQVATLDIKRVGSGLLMQTADNHSWHLADLKVVTTVQPSPAQLAGPAVCLEGGQVREVQCHRVLQGTA
jgi:AICAR transformylase/IMP cyclohydrolase PurH